MTDPSSTLQGQLLADGAHPQFVDAEAMLATIAAMQARLKILETERGVPSDPIEGGKLNIMAHLKARMAQLPNMVATDLNEFVKNLPEELTSNHTDMVKTLVDDLLTAHPQVAHELAYLPQLASDLHKAVLSKALA